MTNQDKSQRTKPRIKANDAAPFRFQAEERSVVTLHQLRHPQRADNADSGRVRVRVARVAWLHRTLPEIG